MNTLDIQLKLGALNLEARVEFTTDLIVISGENGAGKTTLLRCLAGLEVCVGHMQMDNTLWLDSAAGFKLPTAQRKLGFVWAEAVLLPWLDAQANITLGSTLDKDWLHEVCEALEVPHLLKRKPVMLSTGEAQRVALARALYAKPRLLLLDEPFSAQAPDIRARLRQALQGLHKQLNIPVLMVSHDAEDAKVLAHQHWHMREGKLMASIDRHSRDQVNCEAREYPLGEGGSEATTAREINPEERVNKHE